MKPGYTIYSTGLDDLNTRIIYILNWQVINEVGIYGYSARSEVAENSGRLTAIFKIKPKPCQTPS